MNKIENAKTYTGKELETIFFRPMFGQSAENLGVRVMYNMPVPTTLHFWKRSGGILQKYSGSPAWNATATDKIQKNLDLQRVKAEVGYSAEDYFSMVYENVIKNADPNQDDLTGTVLEEAETALLRESITESIRATMWLGDKTRPAGLNTFDGFITRIADGAAADSIPTSSYGVVTSANVAGALKGVWDAASDDLKALRGEGQLTFFVTGDVYNAYEEYLDEASTEAAFLMKQSGPGVLMFRGVAVVDVRLTPYMASNCDFESFIVLTDRRNLALAVNTSDFPGTEIRMWYNPDEMENRQRAIFMAGADYLMPELISFGTGA